MELSASIGSNQHFLSVDLTVKLERPSARACIFRYLQVLETIEWDISRSAKRDMAILRLGSLQAITSEVI